MKTRKYTITIQAEVVASKDWSDAELMEFLQEMCTHLDHPRGWDTNGIDDIDLKTTVEKENA